MTSAEALKKISETLNVPVETFFKDKPKDRIPGYISFEDLELFCRQNIEAIEAGNQDKKQVNFDYDQRYGKPTEYVKMARMQDKAWSRGRERAWTELLRSIELWKRAEGKK